MKSATRKSQQERDRRLYYTRAIASCGNVFIDLGFDEAEAHVRALRVLLIERLRERLREECCTQVEVAKRLGITRPKASALMRGARRDFSLDMLLTFAARAGLKPELHFAAEEKRSAA